jgi:chemotaxis protein methyltransferase CheR
MTLSPVDDISMSDEEFRLFRDCIYRYSGIYFGSDSRYLLEKRLSRRFADLTISSFSEYYHYLMLSRDKDQEMVDIMDILTVNETYFFREAYQLKAFTDEIIPELLQRPAKHNTRSLHIWSAGCSTGEEAYTIAMLLLEIKELQGWKIEIIGSDISQRVLRHARHGVYGTSAFRATDDYYRKRFFHNHDDGLRINDDVRKCVTFSHLNLFDADRIVMLGKMDLVFCRNVIIYFDLDAKKKVVENFYNALSGGGFLLLGHSESLMNISTQFTLRHFNNDMIYQKPELIENGEQS